MGLNGNSFFDQVSEGPESGFNGAHHGAHNDELDIQLVGDLVHHVVPELVALQTTLLRQHRVGDAVVLCGVSVVCVAVVG